ncbi:DUF1810 domain-containing protein [Rhizorhabdus phycosphaerae]|uniref:DUF1810 domain-containing protein n=1 Tax=Rhizorhabdus phycosphaerae TaxID=2711156 RepID=UPI001D01DEE3|nr:DUF1810 domain-containing protein [Rhizorhabdus phycosphaerae]
MHAIAERMRGPMESAFDLDRFVKAQEGAFDQALGEIRRGLKRGHWMWFVFPQLRGLGRSPTARHYGLGSGAEAAAYLVHPLLGARLRACVEALQDLEQGSAVEIFGEVDAMKLRSSLTLFAEVAGERLFVAALERWFDGQADPLTLDLLREGGR